MIITLFFQQGFAFFLFYVVLNPEVRQIILVVWEWKQSAVTPFDEHEAIEIEEEEVKLQDIVIYSTFWKFDS